MAKKSKIARNEQRKVIVERYAAKRLELKKALVDPNGTDESREAARVGLQKLPRNASPVRVRSRDAIDGRPRGVLTQVRRLACPLPRHGAPWRAARHHQVELVGTSRTASPRGASEGAPLSSSGAAATAMTASRDDGCRAATHATATTVPRCRGCDDTPARSSRSPGNPRVSADLCYIRGGPTGHGGGRTIAPDHEQIAVPKQRKSEEDTQWLTSR